MSPNQEKNIVKGNINNIRGPVVIGDNNIVKQEKYKSSKELTAHLPTLREDQIIGRKEDLADVYKRLFDNKQVVLVNGMGGIGKTTIAQVYLTKYYDKYKYIAWVGLNNEANDFESEFVNTEGLLDRFQIGKEGKTIHQLFVELIGAFKELDDRPCLMIIDNAIQELEKYRTYLPNQPNWHLLVTSREHIVDFDIKELGFLKEEDAVLLFKKYYTRSQLSDDFLIGLVKDLEYHTLTIEILAKTAQVQRTAPNDLLNAIQNDLPTDTSIRHSEDKVEKLTSYLCSIFKTSKLEENEKWVLKQFICLPPDYISYELLQELIEEDENISLASTLSALQQKGWLLYNEGIDSYKIHRIIIDVVKRTIEFNEGDVQGLVENIASKLSIDQTKDNPVDKFKWIPYGEAILYHFKDSDLAHISELQNNLAIVLKKQGDYQKAKQLLEKAVFSNEKNFGEDHPNTTMSYSNLAVVLQDLGDYQEAKKLLEKAVFSDEKNFGEDHPNTASRYSNLATVLKELGDYQKAKILLEKAVFSNEKNFGEDHPNTAMSYSNLAVVLQDLGDYQEAKKLLEKAAFSDEKNFGEDHPTTASRYSNLALVLKDLGDYHEAKILLGKAVFSNEKNFGENHPTTAVSYSNLALVLQDLGDYQESKKLLEKAIFSDEKNFGENHPNTAMSYSNLALVLKDLGDCHEAKKLLEKAVKSNEKNFGEDHPNTAVSYSNLALVLKYFGDYHEAKILLEKAVKSNEKNFGEDHPNTAVNYLNLGPVLYNLENFKEAKKYVSKAYSIFKLTLGEDHPSTNIAKSWVDGISI